MRHKKFIFLILIIFLLFLIYICFYNVEKIDLNNVLYNKTENDLFVVGISSKNNYGAFNSNDNTYYFSDGFFDDRKVSIVSPYKTKHYLNKLSDDYYEIVIYSDSFFQKRFIKIVNNPIISISNYGMINLNDNYGLMELDSDNEIDESREYSDVIFEIMDSNYNGHGSYPRALYSNGRMRLRGITSSIFDKKSYKLELSEKLSLLGMNPDDDWILDALYTDKSKIRNKLSSDIWNLINDNQIINNDIKGDFVDVFINNEFRGLYVLKEKVDKNITQVDEDGLLAKSVTHVTEDIYNNFMYNKAYVISKDNGISLQNYEIKYYTRKSLRNFSNSLSNYYSNHGYDSINDNFDIDNYLNYQVFVIFVNGVDNITKNQYYSMSHNDSKILITPWDLDLTFGIDYSPSSELKSIDDYGNYDNYNWINDNITFDMDYKTKDKLKYRYFELRKNILTAERLDKMIDSYVSQIAESSKRDSEIWYSYDTEFESYQIKKWIKNRLLFLDDYFSRF